MAVHGYQHHLHHSHSHGHASQNTSLTEGSIVKGLIGFAVPLFLGQLLQQLYNMADAWVVGNFAENDAFAAVSSGGSLTFLMIGFFNGIAIGGGVIISRYFGANDRENVQRAIHSNFLFGILASILSTAVGLLLVPELLILMKTPDSVLPHSLTYFRIYFAGVSTVILYNICMAIMRALGDSLNPLYYCKRYFGSFICRRVPLGRRRRGRRYGHRPGPERLALHRAHVPSYGLYPSGFSPAAA